MKMKKNILVIICISIFFGGTVFAYKEQKTAFPVDTANSFNVRYLAGMYVKIRFPVTLLAEPRLGSEKIYNAKRGEKFMVIKTEPDWVKIVTRDSSKSGWAAKEWITDSNNPVIMDAFALVEYGQIQAGQTFFLTDKPVFGGTCLYTVQKGEKLYPLEAFKGWILFKTESGIQGWTKEDKIFKKDHKTSGSNLKDERCDETTSLQYWIDHQGRLKLQIFFKCWADNEKKALEEKIYNKVKKIPGNLIEKNKKGYLALNILDEQNATYRAKLKYYSMSAEERKLLNRKQEKARQQKEKNKHEKIKRLYRSGPRSNYWNVIVAPHGIGRSKVKCALYDAAGQVLVVSSSIVEGPLDEIIMRVPGGYADNVESVQCWGL